MNREAVKMAIDQSHERGNPALGFATTILALLAAGATLLGHRAHTLEVRAQTQATDEWGFYQAKHIRAHMYGIEAEKMLLNSENDSAKQALAIRYLNKAIYEQCGSPIDPMCNFKQCGGTDSARGECQVPVLKDSAALQKLFRDHIQGDPRNVIAPQKDLKEPNGATPILAKAKVEDGFTSIIYSKGSDLDVAEILLEFSLMLFGITVWIGTRKHREYTYLIMGIGSTVAVVGIIFGLVALPWP